MRNLSQFYDVLQWRFADLGPYFLGALILVLPILFFLLRKRYPLVYGILEIVFSLFLDFGAAVQMSAKTQIPSATLAFTAAVYVGVRGWTNATEASKRLQALFG